VEDMIDMNGEYRKSSYNTSRASIVAGSIWKRTGTAAVQCQLFVSHMKLNNPKRMHYELIL